MKIAIIAIGVISISSAIVSFMAFKKNPKIAVVRSGVVLDKFIGMKEAKKNHEVALSAYNSMLDSMKATIDSLDRVHSSESIQNKKILTAQKVLKINILEQVSMNKRKKVEEENNRQTTAVLNQFNSYVQTFSEAHGYDIVLGVTLSGNILYAAEAQDITDEVTEGLNNNYLGK